MLLMSPDGKPADIDDPYWINRLKKEGFRDANEDELEAYLNRKQSVMKSREIALANQDSDGSIYYQTVASGSDGYGMSRDLIRNELVQHEIYLNENYHNQKVGLLYSYPTGIMQFRTDVRLIMTMFESDKIPEDWPDYLAMADEVIVPSRWCQKVFKESGIDSTVVPLGYNDRVFKPLDRSDHKGKPFTFIHYNSFNMRKGFAEIFQAFTEEFGDDPNVRLILKTTDRRPAIPIFKQEYPNIEVICGQVSEHELLDILGSADCMVYPSRGEGFGITPLEAMATGLPTIVPNAHGISEYFDPNYMLEVKVGEMCPALYQRFKGQDVGQMVVCDVKHLRKQMRYVYKHQEWAKELGQKASEYVTKYTYRNTAEKLAEVINKWQLAKIVKRNDGKFLQVERV